MMRIGISVFAAVMCIAILSSCNNTKSYADMKRDQQRAINRLVNNNNFEILKEYPSNGVFGEKQFVELDNGVYLNVVDSGNGNRAVSGRTTVLIRFKIIDFTSSDSLYSVNYFDNSMPPLEFLYGNASYIVSVHQSSMDDYYAYMSTGIESILEYVGENAVVKAIIPFEVGSTLQSSAGMALYFEKLRFTYY
ncbi:MAG: DUF4827 domain-containing protein [Tannerella sp.]|jgi:hypothetical protein|nr:DUF4827 domain-containing protein [Tannerella sp.]